MGGCCSLCNWYRNRKSGIEQPLIVPTLPCPPTDVSSDEILKVEEVDVCNEDNASHHYTDKFFHQLENSLIIRRGRSFEMKIKFQRKFDSQCDVICLVFSVKEVSIPCSISQQTMIFVPVEVDENIMLPSLGWKAKHLYSDNNGWITLEVTSSASAIVGEWLLEIDTKTKTGEKILTYAVPQNIYLLFNPWCEEDNVYMPNQEWRKEYVLQDFGLIWKGTYNCTKPTAWCYGQFEEFVLECCCFLLRSVGKLNVSFRADPVKVSRHISAVVNSLDDGGILEAWRENRKREDLSLWSGSHPILQKFYTEKKSVKFGQCWVFAGVCTTVCRCLGIPCRTITNYCSARSTNNCLIIDYFFDGGGNPINWLNNASICCFHVWNELWMKRPDLDSSEYDGWQVIDATPQELSDGKFRCGPASVNGIKEGDVLKTYDSAFVFAELNADIFYWRYQDCDKPPKLIHITTDKIGRFISTKAVSSFSREDVTYNYKYKERTSEVREVMLKALWLNNNKFPRYNVNDTFEDIVFTFVLEDNVIVGSSFTVKLKAINIKESEGYKIRALIRVDVVRHTGQFQALVKKDNYTFELQYGDEHEVTTVVAYSDYERTLTPHSVFNISVMATVINTNFDYFAQDDFRVRMPDITIEAEDNVTVGEDFTVIAWFFNPLPKKLTRGLFIFEGPGLIQTSIKLKRPVKPREEAHVVTTMKPIASGEKTIIVKFISKELNDVEGYKTVSVNTKSDD